MRILYSISFVVILNVSAFASTFYVSTGGLDSNNGSQSQPWLTLQHAADQVQAGDSVLVESGTYSGFSLSTPGTSENPIVFKANGTVLINEADVRDNIEVYIAHYAVIDGFTCTNAERAGISVLGYSDNECIGVVIKNNTCADNYRWGIFTAYARDVVLESNMCSGSEDEHGVYISNSSDYPVLRNNTCFNNNGSGIQINADPAFEGDGIVSYALVENNICYGNGAGGGAGLNFASIRNSVIKNNLIYDNEAGGMAFWDDGFGSEMGCKSNKIYNNTVIMPSGARWAINMINYSIENEIYNNILIHEGNRGGLEIDESSMTGLVSNNNIMDLISYDDTWLSLGNWQTQTSQDINSFSAIISELFVGSGDYHLKEGSPAIDKGHSLEEVDTDYEGDARPSGSGIDIGADEFITDDDRPGKPENVKIRN